MQQQREESRTLLSLAWHPPSPRRRYVDKKYGSRVLGSKVTHIFSPKVQPPPPTQTKPNKQTNPYAKDVLVEVGSR